MYSTTIDNTHIEVDASGVVTWGYDNKGNAIQFRREGGVWFDLYNERERSNEYMMRYYPELFDCTCDPDPRRETTNCPACRLRIAGQGDTIPFL